METYVTVTHQIFIYMSNHVDTPRQPPSTVSGCPLPWQWEMSALWTQKWPRLLFFLAGHGATDFHRNPQNVSKALHPFSISHPSCAKLQQNSRLQLRAPSTHNIFNESQSKYLARYGIIMIELSHDGWSLLILFILLCSFCYCCCILSDLCM